MQKILTDKNCPTEDGEIVLESASITYAQSCDNTENADEIGYQVITVSTRDNGVANFLNIKTDSWSIDKPNDLLDIITDFCNRINYKEE